MTTAGLHDHSACYSLKRDAQSEWGMRHDVRRVMLYERLCDAEALQQAALIHPRDAVMLALLDGLTPLAVVEERVALLFGIDAERACQQIGDLLALHGGALVRGHNPSARKYRPADFLIPSHQVDLERRRLYKPIGVTMHLSDDCMRQCLYCNVEKRRTHRMRNLPLSRWLELVDECAELGMVSISLSGGDPFMRRDVPDVVARLTSHGIHPFCATKSRITAAMAERLATAGLRRLQVSIDAPTAALADLLTGSHGYFEDAVATIRNVRAAGLTVRTNCVMTRLNAPFAPALVDLLVGLGVDTVSLTGFARSAYVPDDLNEALFLTAEERALLNGLSGAYPQIALRVSADADYGSVPTAQKAAAFSTRAQCSAGRWGFIIHSDGKVTLCDEMPVTDFHVVGDVTTQSISEVWKSPRIDELLEPDRQKFLDTACFECPDYTACHRDYGRCFRDALKAYATYYAPSPACPLAPPARRLT